jgi:hypothetical protein
VNNIRLITLICSGFVFLYVFRANYCIYVEAHKRFDFQLSIGLISILIQICIFLGICIIASQKFADNEDSLSKKVVEAISLVFLSLFAYYFGLIFFGSSFYENGHALGKVKFNTLIEPIVCSCIFTTQK